MKTRTIYALIQGSSGMTGGDPEYTSVEFYSDRPQAIEAWESSMNFYLREGNDAYNTWKEMVEATGHEVYDNEGWTDDTPLPWCFYGESNDFMTSTCCGVTSIEIPDASPVFLRFSQDTFEFVDGALKAEELLAWASTYQDSWSYLDQVENLEECLEEGASSVDGARLGCITVLTVQ